MAYRSCQLRSHSLKSGIPKPSLIKPKSAGIEKKSWTRQIWLKKWDPKTLTNKAKFGGYRKTKNPGPAKYGFKSGTQKPSLIEPKSAGIGKTKSWTRLFWLIVRVSYVATL